MDLSIRYYCSFTETGSFFSPDVLAVMLQKVSVPQLSWTAVADAIPLLLLFLYDKGGLPAFHQQMEAPYSPPVQSSCPTNELISPHPEVEVRWKLQVKVKANVSGDTEEGGVNQSS